jgi:coenzyme PQQ precursor peptide PqqA
MDTSLLTLIWPGRCIVMLTEARCERFVNAPVQPDQWKAATLKEFNMKWETPEYSDIRFGFEVTMYINNR